MWHRESVSDKTILQQVNRQLGRAGLGWGSRISVEVRTGDVTLAGNIQYETQRRPLLRAVDGVAGVRRVTDQLQVHSRQRG